MAQQYSVDIIAKVLGQSAVDKLGRSMDQTEKKAKGLNATLGKLGVALGGLALGQKVAQAFGGGQELLVAEQRLDALVKKFPQLAGVQQLAASSAAKFNNTQREAAQAYAALGARLGSQGANLNDLQTIYEGINTVLTNNGATAQEAASANLQLAQALGAGRLAGEEFNAISESAPQILDAVADVLGTTRGELKGLASDGKISAEVLIKALKKAGVDGAEQLAKSLAAPEQALKRLQTATTNLGDSIGKELVIALAPAIDVLTSIVKAFNSLPGPIKAVIGVTAALTAAFAVVVPLVAGIKAAFVAIGAAGVVLGAKILLVVGALAAIGVALKKAYDSSETFREGVNRIALAVKTFAERSIGFVIGFTQRFVQLMVGATSRVIAVVQSIVKFFQQVVQKISELWSSLVGYLVQAWNAIKEPILGVIRTIGNAFKGLVDFIGAQWEKLTSFLAGTPLGQLLSKAGAKLGEAFQAGFQGAASFSFDDLGGGPQAPAIPEFSGLGSTPPPADGGGGGGGRTKKEKDVTAELERQKREMEEQLATSEDLLRSSQNALDVQKASTDEERIKAEFVSETSDILARYNKLIAASKSDAETTNLIDAQNNELLQARLGMKEKLSDLDEKAIKDAQTLGEKLQEQTFQRIGQAIEDTIVAGIESAVDGTKKLDEALQEIASNLLKDLGRLFIRAGISSIAGPGGFGLPGFAEGGIASPGTPALVGERGPEIITPMSPTLVTPFDATREAVAQSAQGIAAEDAFSENAAVLGATASTFADRAAAAKQAEMMASPGGTMNIETTVINSVEYATVDQVQQASAAAAKNARARVFSDLKNKPGARSGIGL